MEKLWTTVRFIENFRVVCHAYKYKRGRENFSESYDFEATFRPAITNIDSGGGYNAIQASGTEAHKLCTWQFLSTRRDTPRSRKLRFSARPRRRLSRIGEKLTWFADRIDPALCLISMQPTCYFRIESTRFVGVEHSKGDGYHVLALAARNVSSLDPVMGLRKMDWQVIGGRLESSDG